MATRVWGRNIDIEMARMEQCLKKFPLIAFDTEYPGTIYSTSIDSNEEEWYRVMKANVESTKVIQCGFTVFNANGEIGGSWEFNFSNFGDFYDMYNPNSVDFLIKHGLDLNKIRNEGVDMFRYMFFPKLFSLFRSQRHVEFVTFQGAYDFAYFISILNRGKLPETQAQFALEVVRIFGLVYDVKVMAGFCQGLGEHLGLSKLAQILNITRIGRAHHAGSDSLLTTLVFIKLQHTYQDSKLARGMLYGIGKINHNLFTPSLMFMCHHHKPLMMLHSGGYDQPPVFFFDPSGVPWMFYNGMYVNQLNHLPLTTFPYLSQTTPFASHYPSSQLLQY